MIHQHTIAATVVIALLGMVACDRNVPTADRSEHLAELERVALEESERRMELERELDAVRLAAERDALERERAELFELRQAIEAENLEITDAHARELTEREATLAEREAQAAADADLLASQATEIANRQHQISGHEMEVAGHQALAPVEPSFRRSHVPVADYGVFYDSLDSYGSWFQTPDYGYVWQPAVVHQADWRPYTRGHWVCTDYGWTWVSDEPFGWATYHYGRWALLRGHGWIWVPGHEWAPAWVTWRESGSHIGWAPLPPETLAYHGRDWDSHVEVTFGIGSLWFSFVEYRHFGGPVRHHYLPTSRNQYIIKHTTNITNIHVHNNVIVNGGPKYATANRRSGRQIPYYDLDFDRRHDGRNWHNPRPSGRRLAVAAPRLDASWNDALRPQRVRQRLDNITVERERPLAPEVTTRFRRERETRSARAAETVREWGDGNRFQQRRLETLQQNRRQAAATAESQERQHRETAGREGRERIRQAGQAQREQAEHQQKEQAAQREQAERQRREQAQREQVERQLRDRTQREQTERQAREQTAQREQVERQQREQAQHEQVERQRREQAAQREQAERQQREQAQRQQVERQRLEQAAQREQVERQRREQQAQREQAERQQREKAQREQTQRQQREQAQRQQAARQQREQAERQRREQAAQREQVERQRREQAQREQGERQRREQPERPQRE